MADEVYLIDGAGSRTLTAMPPSGQSGKATAAAAVQIARIDGDIRTVNTRIDSIETGMAEGFKAAAERDRSQDATLDTLISRSETASATSNRPSWQAVAAIVAFLMLVGGPVVTALTWYVTSQINDERRERSHADEQERKDREWADRVRDGTLGRVQDRINLLGVNPTTPYQFGPLSQEPSP